MNKNDYHLLDQQKFHYLQWGEKSADTYFLYFHATGLNSQAYQDLLLNIHNQFPQLCIMAIDQRGHGQSETIQTLEQWEEIALEYTKILKPYSDKKIILCGHSFGGTIALKLASEKQLPIIKTILLDPVLQPFLIRYKKRVAYWLRHVKKAAWWQKIFVALHRAIIYDKFDNDFANFTRKRRTTFPSLQAAVESYTNKGLFKNWSTRSIENYLLGGTKKITSSNAIELTCSPEFEAKVYSTEMSNIKPQILSLTCPTAVLYAGQSSTVSKDALNLLNKNTAVDLFCIENGVHMFPFVQPEDTQRWIANFLLYDKINPSTKPS